MKKIIEIKVECKGAAVGTLGWFNSIIKDSEFVIKNCKDGTPAIFLKTKREDDKFDYRFLCKKYNQSEDPTGYNITNDGYACEIPEGDTYISGLFNIPLTPACKKAVKELIIKAKDVFAEWW